MTETIRINEADFGGKSLMCRGCADGLLSYTPELPSVLSDSVAMKAFMQQMTELGLVICMYKTALLVDVADLEDAGRCLVAADDSASRGF